MSSDNVELLSLTSNLASGASYTSDPVILGQYISLSIVSAASQDIQISLQFSADGIHWDYSVTRNIYVGDNTLFSHPVAAKYTRCRVTNNGLNTTTYMRVIVYGVPSNSSLAAQITKIGNLNPEVDLGNMPSSFPNPVPRLVYQLNNCNTSLTSANNVLTPYTDLQVYHFGSSGAQITQINNMLTLTTNNTKSLDNLYGLKWPLSDNHYSIKFNALWTFDSNSTLGGTAVIGAHSQYGDVYAFGFTGTLDYDNWGIRYTISGAIINVPRTSFNVDKCDGSLFVPVLDLTKLNAFQILLEKEFIAFYVQHNGTYYLVHQLNTVNNYPAPLMREQSIGFFIQTFINNATVVSSGNLAVATSYWSLSELGGQAIESYLQNSKIIEFTRTVSTLETYILGIQNFTSYNSSSVFRANKIKSIKAYSTSSVTLRGYLNPTLTGTSYSNPSPYSNLRVDTAGTVSSYGNKQFLSCLTSSPIDIVSEYYLKPEDVFAFSGQVASSTAEILLIIYFE